MENPNGSDVLYRNVKAQTCTKQPSLLKISGCILKLKALGKHPCLACLKTFREPSLDEMNSKWSEGGVVWVGFR